MDELKQNYYGSLCTEMYEILHERAPQEELDFYLSYAEKGMKILELDLCQYFGQKKLKYYADFFSSSSSLCCGVI